MTKKISIIDDNDTLLTSLSLAFQSYGYSTITFNCPLAAIEYHSKNPADAYVIDMKMPKISGIEFYNRLCKNLNKNRIPALFLTGVHELEEQALKNTTIGDFVKKPFSLDILIARLEKILSYFKTKENTKTFKVGNLQIFDEKIMATWFGKEILLTKSEFNLLKQLARRPHVVYTRDQLLDICYGVNCVVTDRNIDSHIKRLRQKFRRSNPKIKFDRIRTHYGSGYAWSPQSLVV